MDDEIRSKIIEWIFKNHQHHEENSNWARKCPDHDWPYVNSLDLEKFIRELGEKDETTRS